MIRFVSNRALTYVALSGALALSAPAVAAAAPGLLRGNIGNRFSVRPATMSFGACGGVLLAGPRTGWTAFRGGRYGHIGWRRWSSSALGRASAWVQDCTNGSWHRYRATIRAWRIRRGRYTRLFYSYGARKTIYTEYDALLFGGGQYFWRILRFGS